MCEQGFEAFKGFNPTTPCEETKTSFPRSADKPFKAFKHLLGVALCRSPLSRNARPRTHRASSPFGRTPSEHHNPPSGQPLARLDFSRKPRRFGARAGLISSRQRDLHGASASAQRITNPARVEPRSLANVGASASRTQSRAASFHEAVTRAGVVLAFLAPTPGASRLALETRSAGHVARRRTKAAYRSSMACAKDGGRLDQSSS